MKACIFACSVKAGASLTLVKMVVAQYPCARIFCFEAPEQCEQCHMLLRGARVLGRATIGSQTAHVAHTNACSVHAYTMRTNLRLGSAVLHRTIKAHHIMVANAVPPTCAVPTVNVGSSESLALHRGSAMQNDVFNLSHDNYSIYCVRQFFVLHTPSYQTPRRHILAPRP